MYETNFEKFLKVKRGAIHIGAHEGQERFWYQKIGVDKVIWFEPNINIYNKLVENIKPFPNHIAFNMGVYNKTAKIPLHISNHEGSSSSVLNLKTHKIYHPHIVYVNDQVVDFIRMDDFFIKNNYNINEYNLLNIDVQGAELQVIESFGDLIDSIDYIIAEVSETELYETGALIGDIDKYLNMHNFIRADTYMTEFHWGDAIYIKNNLL